MKNILTLLLLCIILLPVAVFADEAATCSVCGMNLNDFPRNRLQVIYADGTSAGSCAFPCLAVDMKRNAAKRVQGIRVADYAGGGMIDAEGAAWVVDAEGKGTAVKAAFASPDAAREFATQSGGRVVTFASLMTAVAQQGEQPAGGHDHSSHGMPAGSQMIFNPAFGDDIYHIHPKGMWMTTYKFMRMRMEGLQHGTSDVEIDDVSPMGSEPWGYMMTPTKMTMDMQMLMVMYGVTDRFTLMGMGMYLSNSMDMLMNMGLGNMAEPPMRTAGFGDTEVRGIYEVMPDLSVSLGISIPTGDIKQEVSMMGRHRAPYGMQLGSGTVDLRPAITWNTASGDGMWNWGAQGMYTFHPGRNDEGYRLGDTLKVTSWLQRALGPLSLSARLAFTNTERIHGRDEEIDELLQDAPTPDADPRNYGGQRLDGLLGISFAKGPASFGIEFGKPLYQNLNGLQLKTDWIVNAGLQFMF